MRSALPEWRARIPWVSSRPHRRKRKHDVRWVLRAVVDGVVRGDHSSILSEWLAGVRVRVEPREVAARDVDADAMTLLENVRGGEGLDRKRIDCARRQQ